MAVITVLWGLFSYSLSFGSGNSFIGGLHNVFLNGVGAAPDADYAPTIPAQTFMVYQLMFAIITPALIAGAFAERMKFSAMLVFTVLWSIIVYDPMAHMVWGKGGLLNASLGGRFPDARFCGRDGRARYLRGFGAGVRAVSGQARGISERADAAAQRCSQLHWRMPAVGGMVRIQCRQRAGAGSLATSAFVATHFARRRGGSWLGRRGMDSQRQAQRAGRNFGRGGWTGRDHSGFGIREAHARAC